MSFNATRYLLFEKNRRELDNDLLESFSPWMVAKSVTFCDSGLVDYVNDTINTYGNVFPTKEDQFTFFDHIIPRLRRQKIDYIKKPKAVETEKHPVPEFSSRREFDTNESLRKYIHDATNSSD